MKSYFKFRLFSGYLMAMGIVTTLLIIVGQITSWAAIAGIFIYGLSILSIGFVALTVYLASKC